MAVSKSDIKFYLTSLEREMEQTIPSQSLGGFDASVPGDPSLSLIYPETTLSSPMSLYDKSLSLSDYTKIANSQFLNINFEIIQTEVVESSKTSILNRGISNLRNTHRQGDLVKGLSASGLFNDNINDKLRQYRCIAMKNINSSDTAYECVVYIKQNSRNPGTKIRIALERPQNDRQEGVATGGTTSTLVDSSLINAFVDNHFINATIEITKSSPSETFTRTVLSFDSSSGTIVLDSALSESVIAGDSYVVKTSPAQRVPSGLIRPVVGSDRVTDFSEALPSSPININTDGKRGHGNDFMPNDVIYIWLEREMKEGSDSFDANSFTITTNFFTVN